MKILRLCGLDRHIRIAISELDGEDGWIGTEIPETSAKIVLRSIEKY